MLRTLVAFGALASAAAFAPMGARPMGLARAAPRAVSQRSLTMQVAPSSIEKEVKLDAEIFRQLDVDGSGTIEVDELKAIFGKNAARDIDVLMQRADLNGGLDKINPLFFMAVIIFSATVEATALNRVKAPDAMPGDLGFDPLKLYTGKDSAVQRDLELKELNNE